MAAGRIARSDVVGSLLRPSYLRDARKAAREGSLPPDGLRLAEDAGFEFLPADPGWWSLWKEPDGRRANVWTVPTRPFVTKPLTVVRDLVGEEYAFLKANARARTKITVPSPSWHRIFWHPEYSRAAYPAPEDFLRAVAGYLREHVVKRVVALGGDYVQMDAPNYAQWHVDPDNRAAFERWGHDMAAELVADAEVDDLVFAGIEGITRAMHVCRGNAPGGRLRALAPRDPRHGDRPGAAHHETGCAGRRGRRRSAPP